MHGWLEWSWSFSPSKCLSFHRSLSGIRSDLFPSSTKNTTHHFARWKFSLVNYKGISILVAITSVEQCETSSSAHNLLLSHKRRRCRCRQRKFSPISHPAQTQQADKQPGTIILFAFSSANFFPSPVFHKSSISYIISVYLCGFQINKDVLHSSTRFVCLKIRNWTQTVK